MAPWTREYPRRNIDIQLGSRGYSLCSHLGLFAPFYSPFVRLLLLFLTATIPIFLQL
jgi:hypothetical protein